MKISGIRGTSGWIILGLAIGLTSCSGGIQGTSLRSSRSSADTLVNETRAESESIKFTEGMRSNVFTIEKLELTAGSLTLQIVRPDGEIFIEKTYSAPVATGESIVLGMDQGVWVMKVEYIQASGTFRYSWQAQN